MPHCRVRDIDIYYEIHGSGPRLFFIGGSGGDLREKPNVFDGPLTRHFEVLSYDQRGLGRTDVPPGPYTMGDYAEDALGLVRALEFNPTGLMGVSFGGMVAQELLCRVSGSSVFADRAVMACTSAGGGAGASYPLHELASLSDRDRAIRMIEISDTRYDEAWRTANPDKAEAVIKVASMHGRVVDDDALRGRELQLEARSHHDTSTRLGNVSIPVYLCAGRSDGIAPVSNQHALAAALPDATLDFFNGGHLFLMQDRSAYEKIVSFLLD